MEIRKLIDKKRIVPLFEWRKLPLHTFDNKVM